MFRNDGAIARLSSLVCAAAGIKSRTTGEVLTAEELQPWLDVPEITLEEAMKKWR